MKKQILAVTLALAPIISAQAQNYPVGAVAPISAGNYDVKIYDPAELEAKVLNILEKRRATDRAYVERAVAKLHTAIKDHLNHDINGPQGLQTLSDNSIVNSARGISLQEFFAATRRFEEGTTALLAMISNISAIPGVATHETDREGVDTEIDFSPITEHYKSELAKIAQRVQNLKFNIKLPNGSIHTQVGTDATALRGMNLYTAQDIKKMRLDATRLMVMDPQSKRMINSTYNRFSLQKIQNFIQVFGTSQRYRSQSNVDAKKAAIRDIEEMFWTRSYLRAVFGRKIGSFGVHHTKRWFSLDFFGSSAVQFKSQFLFNENELIEMQDLAYNSLEKLTGKTKSVLAAETPFFSRISSFLTFISGSSQQAEAAELVLRYLVADIEEELQIGRAGGLRALRSHYRERYYKAEGDKAHYEKLSKAYLGEEDDAEDDFEADIATVSADSLKDVFRMVVVALENQEDRDNQAKGILETVKRLTAGQSNVKKRLRRQRI